MIAEVHQISTLMLGTCLFLAGCVGLVAGVLISIPFNKNQEHNDTEYPDYRR